MAAGLSIIAILAGIGGLYFTGSLGSPTTTTEVSNVTDTTVVTDTYTYTTTVDQPMSSSSTPICIIPGSPMGMFFRILSSNSSVSSFSGVNVTSTHSYYCPSVRYYSVDSFLADSNEWYSLDPLDGGEYSFVANYLGRNYNFTAELGWGMVFTCATLYLPSGVTNVTTSPNACYTGSSTFTNSTSNESWFFSMTINYSGSGGIVDLSHGGGIEVGVNLTYIGTHNESNVDIVEPLLAGSLSLFRVNENGSLTGLWSYQPPSAIWPRNVSYGESFSDSVTVPYSNNQVYSLVSGDTYLIASAPAFAYSSSNQTNLDLSFRFVAI